MHLFWTFFPELSSAVENYPGVIFRDTLRLRVSFSCILVFSSSLRSFCSVDCSFTGFSRKCPRLDEVEARNDYPITIYFPKSQFSSGVGTIIKTRPRAKRAASTKTLGNGGNASGDRVERIFAEADVKCQRQSSNLNFIMLL